MPGIQSGITLERMPRTHHALPSDLGAGFSTAQARAERVGARRLRHSDLVRVAHGLYARYAELVPDDHSMHPEEAWRIRQAESARAIAPVLPPRLFFAGRTAAAIWGLPVRPSGTADLEVATFAPHRAPRRAGLRAVAVNRELASVVEHLGMRVTDPASTWAMHAGSIDLHDGVALGDAIIHEARIPGTDRLEHPPLATLAELERAATSGRRKGVAQLRRILPLLSPHSASPPESHLRLAIGEWGLPEPQLDFDVYDARGRLIGCSEIAFPEFTLAAEYEGVHHLTTTRQWNRDIEKYRDYASNGWEVLRVTADLLYRRRLELRRQLTEALMRRGWRGVGN